ncbi:hypothetical protein ABZ319_16330 [Nocardia sp. NPDC005978]|uniref:TY-Chap domain-containing protein n=1 Tax=Nocardia sp. NPDC005978 TaxID=3156725 RepID=UPI0033BBC95B
MIDSEWGAVLAHVPWLRDAEPFDRGGWRGISVQIRDSLNDHKVSFVADGPEVTLTISSPPDQTARERLHSILQAQPDGIWRESVAQLGSGDDARQQWPPPAWEWTEPTPGQARTPLRKIPREWHSTCRRGDARDSVVALRDSLCAVMRDGLGMDVDRLRFSLWNTTGPLPDRLWGDFCTALPDRPTARCATQLCSGWQDFADRLTWTLMTFPTGGVLVLRSPPEMVNSGLVQLTKGDVSTSHAVLYSYHDTSSQVWSHMTDIGWWYAPRFAPDVRGSNWIDPTEYTHLAPAHHDVAERTVATFRDVLGVGHPRQLSCFTFIEPPGDCSYVAAELGLPVRAEW